MLKLCLSDIQPKIEDSQWVILTLNSLREQSCSAMVLVSYILCQQHPGAHLGSDIAPLSTQCQCSYRWLEQSRHHHSGKGWYTLQVTTRCHCQVRVLLSYVTTVLL
jgi:hypothetical protein